MKKSLVILMALILVFTMSLGALAVSGTDKGNGKGNEKTDQQKTFKTELNTQKKAIAKQKGELEAQLTELKTQYDALVASGDTAGAEALLVSINDLSSQIDGLDAQMKQVVSERFMVAKTLYSDEELKQFENAAALIAQMYADASVLQAGSVTVKDNIIKFDAPPYIKGGRTLIPVRAITEGLGATVTWDPATQSVTIIKDGKTVVMTLGSSTVTVDGNPVEMDTAAELTCARTFVPLRFLAETFGLDVDWDGENEIIDIDDGAAEEDAGEETGDTSGGTDAADDTDVPADGTESPAI